jgi:ferredoxin
MPKVTFKKENIVVDVPAGTKLVDLAEKVGANINFSCKEGVCLTCLINVLEGLENLNPKTPNEQATLEAFGAKPNQRLACQVIINGDVVIESIE